MQSLLRSTRAVAILLVIFGIALAAAQETSSKKSASQAKHSMARLVEMPDLHNLAEVTPNLYRGAQPSPEGLQKLTNMGINIVVDLRGDRAGERAQVEKLGMTYVAIPWHCPFPKDEVFAKFISLTRANPKKKIFVHCRLGDDRAGMTIASYRMAEQGWSAEEAMNEMESFGFTRSHHFICPSLAGYEKDFPRRFKHDSAFKDLR